MKLDKAKEKKYLTLPIMGEKPRNEKEIARLKEIKTFEFYNIESTGLSLKFSYGGTSNQETFDFLHGGKYKIPTHVARHVENCSTPIYEYVPDGSGKMKKKLMANKSRFQMREIFE